MRRLRRTDSSRKQRLGDGGIHDRAASRDDLECGHQLRAVLQAFLEQVAAPVIAALQQRQAVTGVEVLAEDDDSDVRVRDTQPIGEQDAFRFA